MGLGEKARLFLAAVWYLGPRLAWQLWNTYDALQQAITKAKEETGMVEGKALLSSSTLWLNLIALAVQTIPLFAEYVPQPWGVILTAVLNILNRIFITRVPITGILVQ